MQKKCKICIKNYEIIVDLNDTETAEKIWDSLPINSKINVWGEEIYFYVSVSADLANDAGCNKFRRYWSAGKAIAIGFGKTPISQGNEIRLADKCNVWGKTNFDLKKLVNINSGCDVLVEKY